MMLSLEDNSKMKKNIFLLSNIYAFLWNHFVKVEDEYVVYNNRPFY